MNKVVDYFRRGDGSESRRVVFLEDVGQIPEPYQETDHVEMEDLLARLFLPEHYREIILMHLDQEMSFTEIASLLGMTYEAARSRYRVAIKFLSDRLDLLDL